MSHHRRSSQGQEGFTLVELIMVIALAGVVAVLISTVLSRPMQGFVDQSRRAELVDLAATALNRMARDVRLAVPNSLRARDTQTIELLLIDQAGRYRANQHSTDGVRFDPPRCPASGACSIQVLSPVRPEDAARVGEARWMVLYNLGRDSPDNHVWLSHNNNPGVITPDPRDPEDRFAFFGSMLSLPNSAAGFHFRSYSPQHRFYLAREVIGYRCDNPGVEQGNGTGVIRRASFSSLATSYSYTTTNSSVLVDSVSSCSFSYNPGTSTRGGLVTLRLVLEKGGERIVLLQQVRVDNAP